MERGNYRRVRRAGRARPTEREIQELVALIGGLGPAGIDRKVVVIAPFTRFGLLRESLRKVLKRERMLNGGTARRTLD